MLAILARSLALVAAFGLAPSLVAADGAGPAGVAPYPLDYCATCSPDEKGEELVTRVHKGREVKLCKGCVKVFTADPDGYLKRVDKAIREAKPAK